jgi:hypothetical protein
MKYLHHYGNINDVSYMAPFIPEHIRFSFENYLIHGIHPGGFVSSIIANDIFNAVYKADNINMTRISNITTWIVINMPTSSIGSYDAIKDWCSDKDNVRSRYVEYVKEKAFYTVLTS